MLEPILADLFSDSQVNIESFNCVSGKSRTLLQSELGSKYLTVKPVKACSSVFSSPLCPKAIA
ncbi:hypothetical protein H6F44_11290 [Pseudanabaena sp. FACHB-1277]|uniref:Uncharacterized protein n=1 Tax=Pseudanabaena cinerea FACHB-1277 TaxID=2949581 RepID=A0A926USY2_9CYAN|nr:hypothetical protein [Pseudanabaena cinerea]MBD2150699.1 hypothetical protein [Pseudanabaena cinerea FACHB-1277]